MYRKEQYNKDIKIASFIENYFDEELCLSRCRACSGYQKTWSCPEFDFAPVEYWRNFGNYKLIVEKIYLEGTKTPEEAEERLHREKMRFNKEMRELEALTAGSSALYAQECEECGCCARLDGLPCRFSETMRYSAEALGGNVVKMVKDLIGVEILWVQDDIIPEYYVLVGGILY